MFEKIYKVVSKIPKGKVMTYKQIANTLNLKNPRIVGFALNANKNPQKIPCHRVVSSNGKLTGYVFGGVEKKREILKKEGVKFINNDTVDLNIHLFLTSSISL